MTSAFQTLAIFSTIGWPEYALIFGIFILLFGAKKLPDLARSMGKSIKEFKKATSNIEDDIRSAMDDEDQKSSKTIDSKDKEPIKK
tara:strand:- start:123 stop:380 length:258 start_codon:yes stop_codon:yes gene_type:complete